MPLRPVRLWQQVVDDVHPAWPKQREGLVNVAEFSGLCIRVDQVELLGRGTAEEAGAVHDVKADTGIGTEEPTGDCDDLIIGIDGVEP